MQRFFSKICQIVAVLSLGLSPIAAGDEKTATVVVEHWPPWEIAVDAQQQNVTKGLAIEIAEEMLKRLNTKMELHSAPRRQAMELIEKGHKDLVPMIIKSPDRERYMVFTEPVYEDPVLLAYSADVLESFEWNQWEDLKPLMLGLAKQYARGGLIDAVSILGLRTHEVATDEQSIRTVLEGKVDVAPLFYADTIRSIKTIPGGEKLKFAKKPINTAVFRFGISKKSFLADNLDEVNAVLASMKRDGTMKKILGDFYRE